MANKLVSLLNAGSFGIAVKNALKNEFSDGDNIESITYDEGSNLWNIKYTEEDGNYIDSISVVDEDSLKDYLLDCLYEEFEHNASDYIDFYRMVEDAGNYFSMGYFNDDVIDYFTECAEDTWREFDEDVIQSLMEQGGYDDEDDCRDDWIVEETESLMSSEFNGDSVDFMIDYDCDTLVDALTCLPVRDLMDYWLQFNDIMDCAEDYDFYYFLHFNNKDYYYKNT